jgi:hypothetical protein
VSALSHPDLPGITVGADEDGVVMAVTAPAGPTVTVTMHPLHVRYLTTMLSALAGTGWATATPESPASATAPSTPESTAS